MSLADLRAREERLTRRKGQRTVNEEEQQNIHPFQYLHYFLQQNILEISPQQNIPLLNDCMISYCTGMSILLLSDVQIASFFCSSKQYLCYNKYHCTYSFAIQGDYICKKALEMCVHKFCYVHFTFWQIRPNTLLKILSISISTNNSAFTLIHPLNHKRFRSQSHENGISLQFYFVLFSLLERSSLFSCV